MHQLKLTNDAYWAKRGGKPAQMIDANGYVWIKDHLGHRHEHRAVMEEKLGRKLRAGESVHHINGQRADNRPENLELWIGAHGPGQRAHEIVCPHCGQQYSIGKISRDA